MGLNPGDHLTLTDLARISADRGKLDDAEGYLVRAMALDPENGFVLEERGRVLPKRGREAKSRSDAASAAKFFEQAETASAAAAKHRGVVWAGLNAATALAERAKLQGSRPIERPDVGRHRRVRERAQALRDGVGGGPGSRTPTTSP